MWALSRGPVIDAERELIDAARAGDLDSFGKLCERYYAPLAAVAYSVLRDHQLAEDAVQEAFARGLVNLRRLKETGKFAPWLARICRNVAVSSEEPNWEGEEALSVARRWFQEQFGVTFHGGDANNEDLRCAAKVKSKRLSTEFLRGADVAEEVE